MLGAEHRDRDPALSGPYDEVTPFHEPLVLFAYLSAVTTRIAFATGVLVLPQRQTVLVAKQAAELAVLSGDRLRLGAGWGGTVEYAGLNESFGNRGMRQEEQIETLRQLWTSPLVDMSGRWHRIDRAALMPRPANTDLAGRLRSQVRSARGPACRRLHVHPAGADKSLNRSEPVANLVERGARIQALAHASGRSPIGLEGRLNLLDGPVTWPADLDAFASAGFSHATVNTMGAGLASPQAQIDALVRFANEIGQPA